MTLAPLDVCGGAASGRASSASSGGGGTPGSPGGGGSGGSIAHCCWLPKVKWLPKSLNCCCCWLNWHPNAARHASPVAEMVCWATHGGVVQIANPGMGLVADPGMGLATLRLPLLTYLFIIIIVIYLL